MSRRDSAMFELIPAIDLKGGKCVRLRQGVASEATEYGDDPVAMAVHWQDQGAVRLHLVDLDGAFSGNPVHAALVREIFRSLAIPVQFGGGVRTAAQVEAILEAGADRVILGTVAVQAPELVAECARRFGSSIVVGIDARAGRVLTRGWVQQSSVRAAGLALRMKDLGIERIVYTDVTRDGMLEGMNVGETADLARETGLRVIASGGATGMEDVRALWEQRGSGIEGMILGRALYDKRLDLVRLSQVVAEW
ncbi:MAG: 1-(5-phosphoribosyl)-5-[(5-phosphoribosylamino)methylideneamino]imidazole-4-carboxamide isomerase [Acidobacteriota bacterium]